MAQTSFTPISLYYSSTASAVPTAGNLVPGELAINTADGRLFYKDSSGVVQTLATKDATSGSFTNLAYTGTLTGGTGVVNLGSGQFYKDASGNVGIGVTPSAWGGSYKALQMPSGALSSYSNSVMSLYENSYDSGAGSFKYINSSYAAKYDINSGSHNWSIAPSGTAGNAITFTQAMTLDPAGNLGIGTASPSTKLNVADASTATVRVTSIGNANLDLSCSATTATIGSPNEIPLLFNTTNAERMRIDTFGNLLVGCTSVPNVSASPQQFGTSSSTNEVVISKNTNSPALYVKNVGSGTATAISFWNGTTFVGSITTNGTTTTYGTTSDYRLKDNIAPITGALDVVSKLKPVTYKWKTDNSDGQGFIAHELQEIVPDCVTGEKDGTRIEKYEISPAIPAEVDTDGKVIKEAVEAVMGEREVPDYQGIDTSFLVATLTAAIQELNSKFEEYKASHP